MTIDDLIAKVEAGSERTFPPAAPPPHDQQARFFDISFNYDFGIEPPIDRMPHVATPNSSRRGLEKSGPFDFEFHGAPHEVPDFYQNGPMPLASPALLEIMLAMDPTGIEHAPIRLTCAGQTLSFSAFLPTRSYWAADPTTSEITIRKKVLSHRSLAKITYSEKFFFNPGIPDHVHIFSDTARSRLYWSTAILDECRAKRMRGVVAKAEYLARPIWNSM